MFPGEGRHRFEREGVERAPRVLIPRTFESFKVSSYRFFWGAMMGQFSAMNMQQLAQSWFMYTLTKSPAMLGAVTLANAIPMLTLSLFGGIIADRVQKKYTILFGELASVIIALGVALFITFGIVTWVHLIAASFLRGVVLALMGPSRHAIIPELVGQERLMNAVALNMAGININRLLAPAVAGFLIAGVGIGGVFYIMAGLYTFAFLMLLLMRHTGITSTSGGTAMTRLVEGLQYVRNDPAILTVLIVTLGAVFLSMPYMFLLPIFTEEILKVGPQGLGVLMSVSGIGALAGSLAIASPLGSQRRGLLYLCSLLILGTALVIFSFSQWYTLSLAIMVLVGLGQSGRMALSNTLLQAYTVDSYRGRVMGIYLMEFGLDNFATFGIAVLAEFIGVQWAVGGAAALLVAMAFYCFAFVPRLRHLD